MVKKNKTLAVILGIIGLLLIGSSLFSISNNQQFTLFGESVWIPEYWTAECVERSENKAQVNIAHSDDPTFYSCNSQTSNTYIPFGSGVQCDYEISEFSFATIYVCDGITDDVDDLGTAKCVKDRGVIDSFLDGQSVKTVVINSGDTVYIDTDKPFGDATLKVRYPAFGLRVESADGFVNPTTLSCEINSINTNKFHTVDSQGKVVVKPDFPWNIVTGLYEAKSTQTVTLSEVEGGDPIYITRPNYYNKITQAEDGFQYVDTTKEFKNTNIECIPRTTGCSDEAKIIPLADQSCDMFGGAIVNYAPIEGDSSKLCKYSCDAGKLDVTSDCIQVQQSCPPEKPLWDVSTGLCAGTDIVEPEEQDYSYLILLVFGSVALLGAGVIRNRG